jgi:hypothetical protein
MAGPEITKNKGIAAEIIVMHQKRQEAPLINIFVNIYV